MSRVSSPLQAELVQLYRRAIATGTPLDELDRKVAQYQKRMTSTVVVEQVVDTDRVSAWKRRLPLSVRIGALIVPIVLIGAGVYLVGSATVPIASYYFTTAPQLQAKNLMAPIPQEYVMDVNPLIIARASTDEAQTTNEVAYAGPQFTNADLDYTNLGNWFDTSHAQELSTQARTTEYTIDIPKLNIQNAKVVMGGTDLNQSLIAYPGTALPGQKGAPVIFGHSVLRQFYNPSEKNPRRYTSIFSTIMTLKNGDKIYVTHEGIKYTYVVQEKTEVKPTDVHILSQHYDSNQLKLVTCTPEGTYLRRGVVTAVLVEES